MAFSDSLILPCRLAPPAEYYRMIALHPGAVAIAVGERFNKRCKAAHRFAIADTRGLIELTVPIEKPYGLTWDDTRISLHGNWWELMARALESAYGRTPYFEFYADDFIPLISNPEKFGSVASLCLDFTRTICRILNIQKNIEQTSANVTPAEITKWQPAPYWQVRADKLGFIAGLSILDLIFNVGPEASLILTSEQKL